MTSTANTKDASNPYKQGSEAEKLGKSIHYNPYRNMDFSYSQHHEDWINGYNSKNIDN